MNLEDLKPAVLKEMELNLAEIDAIISNQDAPTFENTIIPMEKTGQELTRVFAYYEIWSANLSSSEFREIQGELSPLLSDFSSKITQNKKLFERIKAVYDASQETPLEADQQRVVQLIYESFAMQGADLDNEIIKQILILRKERVALLSFDNFADWRLQNRMAKKPENAIKLMETVWTASTARVKEEVADMQTVADKNGDKITIEPWDYRFYTEKLMLRSEIKNLVQASWLGLFQKSLQTCGNHFFCKTHYASQEACF